MDRSRRATRRSTGYVLGANDASDRNLRIALRNRHKRAAKALKNDDNNTEQTITRKKRLHHVDTKQSLASIGKRARHQKDTSTPSLNEVGDNETTTSTKDRLSTVQNDVIHTNDITTNTTTDSSTVAIGTSNILEQHQKDTSTPTLNEVDDNATTTSTKDCLSTVQNDVIHTNDIKPTPQLTTLL